MRQGFIYNDGCTENCIKLRIDGRDNAIAELYGDKLIIPLDFEMLDSATPYYQLGLGNQLCYEIKFNDYDQVILSTGPKQDLNYKISDIALDYEICTHPDLTRCVSTEYQNMVLLHDRQIPVNKSDTTWNWSFVLLEAEQSFLLDTSKFYKPKIQKVSVIVEGKPNQLYSQGMQSFEQCNEICKYFAKGKQKDNDANEPQKHLQVCFDLWLDFRMINENALHGAGRRIENASEEATLQI